MVGKCISHDWHFGPGSVYWFEGYFNATEEEMKNWCAENCSGQYMVVRMKPNEPLDNSNLHIKLASEEDIILFRLTWI